MGKSHINEVEKVGARRDGCMRLVMLAVLVATVVTMVFASLVGGF